MRPCPPRAIARHDFATAPRFREGRTIAGSSRCSRRIVFICIGVWLVLFCCSPPRLATTQLLRVLGQSTGLAGTGLSPVRRTHAGWRTTDSNEGVAFIRTSQCLVIVRGTFLHKNHFTSAKAAEARGEAPVHTGVGQRRGTARPPCCRMEQRMKKDGHSGTSPNNRCICHQSVLGPQIGLVFDTTLF